MSSGRKSPIYCHVTYSSASNARPSRDSFSLLVYPRRGAGTHSNTRAKNPSAALIVVVDDFNDARERYAEYLTFRGYRVVSAVSGAEALEVAHQPQRSTPILMDVQMLGMDGTPALRSLRNEPAVASVPIMAFTAHARRDEHDAAMRAGFDAVIAKPRLPDDLITLIDPFLDGQGGPRVRRVGCGDDAHAWHRSAAPTSHL